MYNSWSPTKAKNIWPRMTPVKDKAHCKVLLSLYGKRASITHGLIQFPCFLAQTKTRGVHNPFRFAITWFTQVSGKGIHVHVSSERVSMYYKTLRRKLWDLRKGVPVSRCPFLFFFFDRTRCPFWFFAGLSFSYFYIIPHHRQWLQQNKHKVIIKDGNIFLFVIFWVNFYFNF